MPTEILKLPEDYKTLSFRELDALKASMRARITLIEGQIERSMKMNPIPAAGFGSRKWFDRAVKSRKAYEADVSAIAEAVSQRSKGAGPAAIAQTADMFVVVARRRLDNVVFQSIMDEAKAEIQE